MARRRRKQRGGLIPLAIAGAAGLKTGYQWGKKKAIQLRQKQAYNRMVREFKARPGYSKHMDWRIPTFEVWKKLNYPPKTTGGILSKVRRIFKKKR